MRRFTVVCEESQATRVERLATQYGVTEQEVLRQLVAAGLESVEGERERRARGVDS